MKTRNSEQYVAPRYLGVQIIPVLDDILKNLTFAPHERTMYIPIPVKKFRRRKFKSKNWHKRRQEKISEYVEECIRKLDVKI